MTEAVRRLRSHLVATYPEGPIRAAAAGLREDAAPSEIAAVGELILRLLASKNDSAPLAAGFQPPDGPRRDRGGDPPDAGGHLE